MTKTAISLRRQHSSSVSTQAELGQRQSRNYLFFERTCMYDGNPLGNAPGGLLSFKSFFEI